MSKELPIAERLLRLVINADERFTWWRLKQESSNLYRFIGATPATRQDPAAVVLIEEETLLDLLAATWAEGLEDPIPQ